MVIKVSSDMKASGMEHAVFEAKLLDDADPSAEVLASLAAKEPLQRLDVQVCTH